MHLVTVICDTIMKNTNRFVRHSIYRHDNTNMYYHTALSKNCEERHQFLIHIE